MRKLCRAYASSMPSGKKMSDVGLGCFFYNVAAAGVTSGFCSCLAPLGRERNFSDLPSAWEGSARTGNAFWEAVM